MTKTLNRWLPSITLVAWSFILLYFYLSGRVAAFLYPTFRPGVLIAGLILLGFAIGSFFVSNAPECCDDATCGHAVTRGPVGKLLAFSALLVPIILTASLSHDGFGATTIANRGVITDASQLVSKAPPTPPVDSTPYTEPPLPTNGDGASGSSSPADSGTSSDSSNAYIPRSPDGNIEISVIDLLYAAEDESLRKDFDGKTVEMVGQLMADKTANPNGNRIKLVRMFMTCCAADAKPVAALIELPKKTDIPELSWVRVIGIPAFPLEGGKTTALLKASSIKISDPPEETMLY